ncbi:FecCD family ABC transporter permease [Butyrivibrio sp. MC2013]|uniref:FecCD family ABC transporter permease n=1 Tax=Butyrivibrio sp. MC2013 TaxID=1280686 RepID=UPI0004245304|nr:iron ABC transporter permease [Butyrivibrio sp. MC2013]
MHRVREKTTDTGGYAYRCRCKNKQKEYLVIAILAILVMLLWALLLMIGDRNYSPFTVIKVLSGDKVKGASYAIRTLRLPRLITGSLAGLAFGVAGNTFQKIMRNPLASPDVMGISSGAGAGAVFSIMMLGLDGPLVSVIAMAGAVFTALGIIFISGRGRAAVKRMILTGIGAQAMLQAMINYIILKSSDYDVAEALRWLSGSLNGSKMKDAAVLAALVFFFMIVILCMSRRLQILELGEELPVTLGADPGISRFLLIMSAVMLCAAATAVTGPLSFVAFMAGPISSRLLKTGGVGIIPSGLVGVVLVLVSDLIGQFAFETRYPAGVITGIIGAPYLIYLLVKMSKGR